MKTALKLFASTAIGVACGIGAVGCSGADPTPSRPAPESLAQGLTLISASPTSAVSAAYKKGSRVVYFESLRGEPLSDFYTKIDPGLGTHEMDARFVDARGHAFIVQRGGDKFVDPSWVKDMDPKVKFDPADVPLAGELADALQAHALASDPSGAHHTRAANNLAHAPDFETSMQSHLASYGVTPETYWTFNGQAISIHIHWAPLGNWFTGMFGDHSTTHSTSTSYALYACNHGRCANDSSMNNYSCYTNPGWSFVDTEQNGDGNMSVSGACYTPYSWNAGGGNHNCHGDSTYEEHAVMRGYLGDRYSGECSGQNFWKAPGDGNPCP